MVELADSAVPGSPAVTLVSAQHTRWLLLGLALATGMEFYTFDSVNLVLTDVTGTLGLSADEASWLLTVYSSSLFFGVPIFYALTAAAARPLMAPVIASLGQRKTIALALLMLIASMGFFQHFLTSGTPTVYYIVPLVLYGLCLSPLLPAVGSGTVARVEQEKLLDAVSHYMTFRQFGASLGVALLNILLARRETLHSARLFDHLQRDNVSTHAWLAVQSANAMARGGHSNIDSQAVAIGQLAQAARDQAATLSYADAFGFMALVGVVALCTIPVMPPSPVVRK